MITVNDIAAGIYRPLAADSGLAGLCSLYRGGRRPVRASGPSATVEARSLAPGGGEGLWTCGIAVTARAGNLANGMPDHETLNAIVSRICAVLENAAIDLPNAKALPLTRGSIGAPVWDATHGGESAQECAFGLTVVCFS
jgi:hypothetical protein